MSITDLPSEILFTIAKRLRPLELIRLKASQKSHLREVLDNPDFLCQYNKYDHGDEVFLFAHTSNASNTKNELVGFRVEDGMKVTINVSAILGSLVTSKHTLTLICAKSSFFLFTKTSDEGSLKERNEVQLLLVDISGRGKAVCIPCKRPLTPYGFMHQRSNTRIEISEEAVSIIHLFYSTGGEFYGSNVRRAVWKSSNEDEWLIEQPELLPNVNPADPFGTFMIETNTSAVISSENDVLGLWRFRKPGNDEIRPLFFFGTLPEVDNRDGWSTVIEAYNGNGGLSVWSFKTL